MAILKPMSLSQGSSKTAKSNRKYLIDLAKYLANTLPDGSFVFKGGLVIGDLTGVQRYTRDVDIHLVSSRMYEVVKECLDSYGKDLIAHGVISSYDIIPEITDKISGGAKFRNADGSILFSIDVGDGFNSNSTIIVDDKDIGLIRINSVESVLADKLTVLYSVKRFRRLKDLLDVQTICHTCIIYVDDTVDALKIKGNWPLPENQYPFTDESLEMYCHAFRKYKIYNLDGTTSDEVVDVRKLAYSVGRFLEFLGEGAGIWDPREHV